MNFLWIVLKDLTLVGRDKKAILTLVMMPLLLISILGAAFGNMFKEDQGEIIQKFQLGIVNKDEGPLGEVLVDEGFKKGLSKQIDIKTYEEKKLNTSIRNQQVPVGLVIEKDFSASLLSGKKAKIHLLTGAYPGVKAVIVQNVIDQFSQYITIEAVSSKLAQPVQAQQAINVPVPPDKNTDQSNQPTVHETTINAKTLPVNSFQYYSAAMGVMFLLMTVVQGVTTMILEKEQEVYKRLLVTNLTYGQYLTGKFLGLIVVCLVQAFIMIAGTKLLFGVDWGSSLSGLILVTFSYVVSASGLGVLVGSIFKTEKSFGVAGMLGSQIFAALGGSMAPLYIFPEWMVSLIKVLPNGLALQTYFDLMSGASFAGTLSAAGGLLGLGALFFAIGLLRLSLERRREYA